MEAPGQLPSLPPPLKSGPGPSFFYTKARWPGLELATFESRIIRVVLPSHHTNGPQLLRFLGCQIKYYITTEPTRSESHKNAMHVWKLVVVAVETDQLKLSD